MSLGGAWIVNRQMGSSRFANGEEATDEAGKIREGPRALHADAGWHLELPPFTGRLSAPSARPIRQVSAGPFATQRNLGTSIQCTRTTNHQPPTILPSSVFLC